MNKYVKYGLIIIGTLGVGFGAYKLYQHVYNKDGFKMKFGRKIQLSNANEE